MELSNYEKNVSRNTYKANAYKKAAGVLSQLTERVKSGAEVSNTFPQLWASIKRDRSHALLINLIILPISYKKY
jgi:hypothetical protein